MNNVLLGAGSLVAGYIGASLLNQTISHHASDPCPNCTKLNCDQVLNPICQNKCNQKGGLQPFIDKCLNTPLKPLQLAFGGGPDQSKVPVVPDTSTDADCNSWGPAKSLCIAGKSLTKGAQDATASIGGPCVPGIPIPCAILVVGGALAAILLLKR